MRFYQYKRICYYTLLTVSIVSCKSKTDETAAIRSVLEKESATWRSGDIKAHAACWYIQPYSRILVSLPDGKTIDVQPDAIINPQSGSMEMVASPLTATTNLVSMATWRW